jgi:hypothetical protein
MGRIIEHHVGKKPDRRRRGRSHVRLFLTKHKRLISLIGALIVFLTFVTKDAIREHVKDTVDSLQSAEDVFDIRSQHQNSVDMLNSISQHVDEIWKTTPGRAEYLKNDPRSDLDYDIGEIKTLILEAEANLGILGRLVERLPASELPVKKELSGVRGRYKTLNETYTKVSLGIGNRSISEDDEDGWLVPLGTDSENLLADIGGLSAKARDSCEAVKRRTEGELMVFTWVSYGLYAIGWFLTLFGRLFDSNDIIPEA